MKRSILLVSCLFLLFSACSTVSKQNATNAPLHLTWQVTSNINDEGSRGHSSLTVTNTGETALPAQGWQLYFNIGNLAIADDDTSHVQVAQINGDAFRLFPDSLFRGLAKGDSLTIQLVSRKIRNLTDFPAGFYLVLDEDTTQGIDLPFLLDTPSYVKQEEVGLAAYIFEQNQKINSIDSTHLPLLFPTPTSYTKKTGKFSISDQTPIYCDTAFLPEANYFVDELEEVLGSKLLINQELTETGIHITKKELPNTEAYELDVTPEKITIGATGNAGVFYALQSLKVLLPPNTWQQGQRQIEVPQVAIRDQPRFSHRAFLLDVARNFQSKEQVFKVLDLMALYKLNVFHFHIVEDEGWRLAIPGLPELTAVGANRGHTYDEKDHLLPSYGSGATAGNSPGSGYYTREDYIEILRYATQRHIKVITEIETPGHARAAIKAMGARYERLVKEGKQQEAEQYLLHDSSDRSVYRSVQGFDDNVINVALPSTYTFLEKVTDELISMYEEAKAPLESIHFGGDEVPEGVWEKSPVVKKLMASQPNIQTNEDLWHYFFDKLNQMLTSKKIYLSGWEEIGLTKTTTADGNKKMVVEPRFANNNFHVDVWNNLSGNEDLAYKLANAGYQVVLTNVTNMYLDLAYNPSFYELGQYWGGYVDIEKPFRFIPYDYYRNQTEDERGNSLPHGHFVGKEKLTATGKKNIVGLQAPLWSEKIIDADRLEYLLLPKILGLAERAWAPDPEWANTTAGNDESYRQAWSVFTHAVGTRELPRLDHYKGGFSYRIPTPGVKRAGEMVQANTQFPGLTIRYTTDGSEPTINSTVYTAPIPFQEYLTFRVFNQQGRGSRSIRL
ncbi:carbohydate-binding domain-containing protein [Olivibacter sp. SDN3]|uniref:family 20 glycosylhydrolase n=1 Tax=Olivibacter sp. SDN3 TaxID=2764720 RepID=UPI001650EC96|nr:family 20 glycosylhydrolase [Olivibacter sp. SDN3]QNL48278.1 carbohydate-binding domain-containing protein [Olivibacter sp. SDN3]